MSGLCEDHQRLHDFHVLSKGEPMGNAELRSALRASGYNHSLEPGHVSKTLVGMVQSKRIRRKGTGTGSKYLVK